MKPDWDKLMKNWNKGDRAKTSLIADVDCTSDGGKPICEEVGVRGYPTIKWGDASALEDYAGGRTYDDLKKFAKESLKPVCSPGNLDLCDDEKKKEIAALQALSSDDLDAKIDEKKTAIKEAESTFETSVKELQATYERLQKEKDEAIAEVKKSGLGQMQAVQAHAKKAKEEL